VNHNKLITEELRIITALMSYDRSKTLLEQGPPDSVMDRRLGITQKNADALGMSVKDYEREVFGLHDTSWDHETSGWVELGLTLGGLLLVATGIGAPLGGAMIAAGTAVGITDAAVYYAEGDSFMGTTMLALQLIPGGELVKILKGAKSLLKVAKYSDDAIKMYGNLTESMIKELNEKGAKGTLTKTEKEVMEMINEATAKQAPKITKEMLKGALIKFQLSLYEATLEGTLAKTLPILVKILKWGAKTTLMIGGITISVDMLWKLATVPEGQARQVRNESDFGVLLDMLYGYSFDKSPEWVQDAYLNIWRKIFHEDGTPNYSEQGEMMKLLSGNITLEDIENNPDLQKIAQGESVDRLRNEGIKILGSTPVIEDEEFTSTMKNHQPVTFSKLTNGLQTIRKGQKGSVVRDIQRMLVTLGYDLGTTGKTKDGVDGDFGDSTEAAVYGFQINYDLDGIDGIVGKETSNKLYELYKEKLNPTNNTEL